MPATVTVNGRKERVTVREPHKGRLGGLRRSDQTHDTRIRALARG
jgi:hypothetical protein